MELKGELLENLKSVRPQSERTYALVTGATSGLGLAFARKLSSTHNLILVAQNLQALKDVAAELPHAQYFSVDLTSPRSVEKLREHLKDVRISLLVNNAGCGYFGDFNSQAQFQSLIDLNISAVTQMCFAFRDDLKDGGAVINVSSAASYQPIPNMAVYAASKAFVQSFSQALFWEWRAQGTYVQTLVPGAIATPFNSKIGIDVSRMKNVTTAEDVVKKSLDALASRKPLVITTPGTLLQKFFATFFPAKIVLREVEKLFKKIAVRR